MWTVWARRSLTRLKLCSKPSPSRSTLFEEPAVHSTGVCYLFLAGKLAIDEDKPSEKLHGRALRHVSALATKGVGS